MTVCVDDVASAAHGLMRLGRSSRSHSSRSLHTMDPWNDEVSKAVEASWSGYQWRGIEVATDEAGLRGLRATSEIPPNTLVTMHDGP